MGLIFVLSVNLFIWTLDIFDLVTPYIMFDELCYRNLNEIYFYFRYLVLSSSSSSNYVLTISNFLMLQVTTPTENSLQSMKGTSRDKFKVPKRGTYKFRFRNHYWTPATVSFYIHVGHIPSEQDLAKDG